MWLRHSHSLHHQSAFVVFICLPSDTDSIPHPSASAAPLSKCLADGEGWVDGGLEWGGRASHINPASHSYSQICRKNNVKMLCSDLPPPNLPFTRRPRAWKSLDLLARLAPGACGVHSFAAFTPTFILSLTHSVVLLLPSLPQRWKPD